MRIALSSLVCAGLLSAPAAGQILGFDDFAWSLTAPAGYSGTLSSELMHVESPTGGFCSESWAAYETTAPWDGTVTVHVDWTIFDICHFDWPLYVIDGVVTKYSVDGDDSCFLSGQIELEFEVTAGQSFGLGVGSADCFEGPGVADYTQFSFSPPRWTDLGKGLDPRLDVAIPATAGETRFGATLALVGDTDADGIPDLAVGAPFSAGPEAVSLVSGDDGSLLWTATHPFPHVYGNVLAAPGDVDGDTVPDLAVASYSKSKVDMLSGVDGGLIWSWVWSGSELDYYASGLVAFGDRNGDGVTDLAVGASSNSNLGVRILSGADGGEIGLIPASAGDVGFGQRLGAPGDLTGDGVGEIIAGTRNDPVEARVFSGSTGTLLYLLEPTIDVSFASFSFSNAGNVDGDSVADIAVGLPYAYLPGEGQVGAVALFAGATGDELAIFTGPHDRSFFGEAVLGGIEADGDGVRDLAIGIPDYADPFEPDSGRVQVVRTSDGATLQVIRGTPESEFGTALARMAPTVLAVGAPGHDGTGGAFRYSDLDHPAGAPRLSFHGKLVPATPFAVTIEDGLPFNSAMLIVGLTQIDAPLKGGVLVPSADVIVPLVLDGSGQITLGGLWPPGTQLIPALFAQAWLPDPSGPAGWSATNGLQSP